MNQLFEKLKSHYVTDRAPSHNDTPDRKPWHQTSLEEQHRPCSFRLKENGEHAHNLPPLQVHQGVVASIYHLVHWRPHHRPWRNNTSTRVHNQVNAKLHRTYSDGCLGKKYGEPDKCIGKGSFGTVRLVQAHEKIYAVKELKRPTQESVKSYVSRVTAEFLMMTRLRHRNIVACVDLLPLYDDDDTYCQVMEYCNAGDLFEYIARSEEGLDPNEANCFFKQLIRGVHYLQLNGIAHRDIKPENLLLTTNGCLKIADFGSAVYFIDSPYKGPCGSLPYVAPEELNKDTYDVRFVDVWSCGIVFTVLRKGHLCWEAAKKGEDKRYDLYLLLRQRVEEEGDNEQQVIAGLNRMLQRIAAGHEEELLDIFTDYSEQELQLVYRMLEPNPRRRLNTQDIMENTWFQEIVCCQPVTEETWK